MCAQEESDTGLWADNSARGLVNLHLGFYVEWIIEKQFFLNVLLTDMLQENLQDPK